MLKILSTSVCLLSVGLSTGAQSASLDGSLNGVLVNRGSGFAPATSSELAVGDTVMVKRGAKIGKVKIIYDSGCSVPVSGGSVITISATTPCVTTNNPVNAPSTVGQVGVVEGAGLSVPAVLAGAGIIGGGALLALSAKSSKTSP